MNKVHGLALVFVIQYLLSLCFVQCLKLGSDRIRYCCLMIVSTIRSVTDVNSFDDFVRCGVPGRLCFHGDWDTITVYAGCLRFSGMPVRS